MGLRHVLAAAALVALAGCSGLPRDSAGTLDAVEERGTMRVGAVSAPPFVEVGADGEPTGAEADLVTAFAREHGAEVEWTTGPVESLVEELRVRDLDAVVGGFTAKSPFAAEVALTRPYVVVRAGGGSEEHVIALPPGENALLVAVERYLRRSEADVAERLGGERP